MMNLGNCADSTAIDRARSADEPILVQRVQRARIRKQLGAGDIKEGHRKIKQRLDFVMT